MNFEPAMHVTSEGTSAAARRDALLPERDGEIFSVAQALIGSRQNVSPKRLVEPGPSAEQLDALLALAAAAPDHGLLMPWRFIFVPAGQRRRLAEAFALALIDRDPGATLEQIESAREKAHRSPVLLVALACLGPREPNTPPLERMVSMGAAIQNLLLGAHAMGFGAGLTSGQAMASRRLHDLCALADGEVAVCCVNIGTVSKRRASARLRPAPSEFVSTLRDDASNGLIAAETAQAALGVGFKLGASRDVGWWQKELRPAAEPMPPVRFDPT